MYNAHLHRQICINVFKQYEQVYIREIRVYKHNFRPTCVKAVCGVAKVNEICVNVATTFVVYLEGYVTGKCRLYAPVSTHVVELLYETNSDSVFSRIIDSHWLGL